MEKFLGIVFIILIYDIEELQEVYLISLFGAGSMKLISCLFYIIIDYVTFDNKVVDNDTLNYKIVDNVTFNYKVIDNATFNYKIIVNVIFTSKKVNHVYSIVIN